MSSSTHNFENSLIENRYVVGPAIGKGSFGMVYEAKDQISGKTVAIKFENRKNAHTQLQNECRVSIEVICLVIIFINYIYL